MIGINSRVTCCCISYSWSLEISRGVRNMASKLHAVMETFPQFEELVRELSGTNLEFESLCRVDTPDLIESTRV